MKISTIFCFWLDKTKKKIDAFLIEKSLVQINESDKIKVLGVGSNTLIRDGGYNGVIIKFGKNMFAYEKNLGSKSREDPVFRRVDTLDMKKRF